MKTITSAEHRPRAPKILLFLGVVLSVLWIQSCGIDLGFNGTEECPNGISRPCIPEDEPFQKLSDYNLFTGEINKLDPWSSITPYDLNTPLFSDYADKQRFVYIPPGRTAEYQPTRVFDFPVGSVLIKNFFYELNQQTHTGGRRLLETRLLIHYEEGWSAETYVWNEEQTEATLARPGDQKSVNWIDGNGNPRTVNYLIPTKNDCKTCHSHNGALVPLGPKARNLNKLYEYDQGEENQLEHWERLGHLRDKPESGQIPMAPVWDDPQTGTIGERARIYLDVNCSNCHNGAGSANNSGLFLSLEERDPFRLGICKTPIASGPGSGGLTFDVVPCQPEQSILHYRMQSTELNVRMPEIGRTLVHEEAVDLIRQWIEQMECTSCSEN